VHLGASVSHAIFSSVPAALVILFGPPLPGRFVLARELETALCARRFPLHSAPARDEIARALLRGEYVLIDGDLPTFAERRAILSIAAGTRCVAVEWRCGREQADREIFHRFAGRPRCLADAELERYLADAELREPARGAELGLEVIAISAGEPLPGQLEAVVTALPPRPESARPMAPKRNVLIVEDDVEERIVLAEVLRELGFGVELAPDAGVALALLEDGLAVDLVLSDHRMPGMTGVELVRELWARHPAVRAVLLTAYGDEPTCAGAVDAHAVTVLSKPVHILDLQRALEEAPAGPS
jgi:CheY-like chemotaxis protein